ncbi:MAG TPA: hypothetical protein VFG10_08530 [Saprospiraceae bacterium]|nr:hypothetical protein [Saprospiraceae bacterium]
MGKTLSKGGEVRVAVVKTNGKTLSRTRLTSSKKKVNKVYDQEVTQQVDKIISALEEAKDIQAGRKKGKSFDEFLKEL